MPDTDTDTKSPLPEIYRLTDDEIIELARAMITNQVYLVWGNMQYELELSFGFMLSMIVGQAECTEDELTTWANDLGGVYANYSDASPRSVNGLPMFFACKLLHREDCVPLWDKCAEMAEALGIPLDEQEPAQPGDDPFTPEENVEIADALDAVKRKVGADDAD